MIEESVAPCAYARSFPGSEVQEKEEETLDGWGRMDPATWIEQVQASKPCQQCQSVTK